MSVDLHRIASWTPPVDWIRLLTLEAHAGGEPLRIVVSGYPALEGASVPEVSDSAWLCGRNELWLAPDDPFAHGFLLR